jgi:hypothetical protein
MYISIFNNIIMKMEGPPLIYNNNLLESKFLFKLLSKYSKPEVTIQQNGDLLLNEQAPVTIEFLRKHTDNSVMEPLKLMNK